MSPHEAAQNVVWFVVLVFVGIGVVLWFDYRKEKKGENDGL
jgi:cbb3-type cytochrome oxidase subunit 3